MQETVLHTRPIHLAIMTQIKKIYIFAKIVYEYILNKQLIKCI